ncbi:MAG TPA: gamma-glutamyltransferase [Candidatus Acidoferrales bacterium]|nr:gamma-glutamyltransferase [Candidatus Acidoferrales bacterium]
MTHEIKVSKSWRPLVMGRNGMVAAGHHLSALSGLRVLQEGGNAVDAALAAGFTLAVVRPEACGLGGDLFALVYMNQERVEALNASGPAPSRASIDFFRANGLDRIPSSGPLSIAIPGAVDGWMALHEKYGTMELERLVADAVRYAREGFPLFSGLVTTIEELAPIYPDIDAYFRKPISDLRPGRLLVQKGVAQAFEAIARAGREGFYGGELGERLCAAIQARGGIIGVDDLRGNFAEWLEPLRCSYKDYQVFEQPPVSQGFMVLEMLNIIENFPLAEMSLAEAIHIMVEAKKIAFADRIAHLEDPKFGDPQVSRLIAKEYAAQRAKGIAGVAAPSSERAAFAGGDTDYLCVVDGAGNAVSLIQSVFAGFGSRVVAGDTGVVMNNRLSSFGLDASRANALKPGKRPAHTLNSYMVFLDNRLLVVGGTPGADDQPQSNLQILYNLLERRMDPQTAIEQPRWSHRPGTPPNHEGAEVLRMESGFPADVVQSLQRKGHKVETVGRWAFGGSQVIVQDPVSGSLMGGADPRRQGYALGW